PRPSRVACRDRSSKAGAQTTTTAAIPGTRAGPNAKRAAPEGVGAGRAKLARSGSFEARTEGFQAQPLQDTGALLFRVDLEHGDADARAKHGGRFARGRAQVRVFDCLQTTRELARGDVHTQVHVGDLHNTV